MTAEEEHPVAVVRKLHVAALRFAGMGLQLLVL